MKEITGRNIDWELLRGSTVLVTGATGMLASYVVYTLMYLNQHSNLNVRVIALVRNKAKAIQKFGDFHDSDRFRLVVQDICDPLDIADNVDYIVHAAGNASPKYILSDPVGIIKANTLGTMNVLEFARRKAVRNLLFTSTREVYGQMPECTTMILESDYGASSWHELRACYPESKRLAETMLEGYRYQYDIPYTLARIAHSYGPGMNIDNDGRVMSDFISNVVNHRDIVLKSDGSAIRAFCYISDAVSGIFTILLHGENGEAYNIANESEPMKIRDVANELVELFPERRLKVVFDIPSQQSAGYSKIKRVKLDTRKLEELGWVCEVGLLEGMRRTVESFLSGE